VTREPGLHRAHESGCNQRLLRRAEASALHHNVKCRGPDRVRRRRPRSQRCPNRRGRRRLAVSRRDGLCALADDRGVPVSRKSAHGRAEDLGHELRSRGPDLERGARTKVCAGNAAVNAIGEEARAPLRSCRWVSL
jgi:hypothetical protein